MDPEIKQELYINKYKVGIISLFILAILLPVVAILPQISTQFKQFAEENTNPLTASQISLFPSPAPLATLNLSQSRSNTTNTNIQLTVCLHGIGNCGDNAASQSAGNMNPLRLNRQASVDFFNANKQLVKTLPVILTYIPALAKFTTTVNSDLPTGGYYIKISNQGYIAYSPPNIQNIYANQPNILLPISLTTGDIDHNNIINTADISQILQCFDRPSQANPCSESQRQNTDLNDDGIVNGIDYNLLMREATSYKAP